MHQKDQERDGCPPPNRLAGPGERRELPQRGPGRSPDRQRIFGIFEAHSTLQPQALRPNKDSYFFRKKNPLNRRLGGMAPWPPSGYTPGRKHCSYLIRLEIEYLMAGNTARIN